MHNKLPQPDTTTTIPRATTQARAGAVMIPSSCPDGLNPQYTRAWYAREAVGCSLNSTQLIQHGSGASVAPQSLRSVHKTRQDETVCVAVIPYQNLWSCKEVQVQSPTE